jgi:hypothetical protein
MAEFVVAADCAHELHRGGRAPIVGWRGLVEIEIEIGSSSTWVSDAPT